jgi:hypothetical protein
MRKIIQRSLVHRAIRSNAPLEGLGAFCRVPLEAVVRPLLFGNTQLPSNEFTEAVLDLHVPWHGRLFPSVRVSVDVVFTAMPLEVATGPHELTNELRPFHVTSTDISLVLRPGRFTSSTSPIMS